MMGVAESPPTPADLQALMRLLESRRAALELSWLLFNHCPPRALVVN